MGQWNSLPGRVTDFSIRAGDKWATTPADQILHMAVQFSTWSFIAGGAQQVAAAADGRAWVLRTDLLSDNIYRYDPTTGTFEHIKGTLRQISAADGDNAVGVNYLGDIYRYQNNAWTQLPGKAIQVSMGVDYEIFAIDANSNILRLVSGQWQPFGPPKSAIYIDVHDINRIIIADSNEYPYSYSDDGQGNTVWQSFPVQDPSNGKKCAKVANSNVNSTSSTDWYCMDVAGTVFSYQPGQLP